MRFSNRLSFESNPKILRLARRGGLAQDDSLKVIKLNFLLCFDSPVVKYHHAHRRSESQAFLRPH